MDLTEFVEFSIFTLLEYIIGFTKWLAINILLYILMIFLIATAVQYVASYDSKIRFIACYTVLVSWFVFILIVTLPYYVLNARAGVINCLFGAYTLRPVTKIIGIDYELRNGKILSSKSGTAVIAANHQAIFDVSGMFAHWHVMRKCTVIARKEVFYFWPFGLAAWLAGVVFIDRSSPSVKNTYAMVNKAAEYVCREKAKLWIFVEGSRNKTPEKLLPFKKGAFRVAISSQIPIIPVVYSPYYFINWKTMYFGRGKIIIEALEPIPTKGLTLEDMDDLMAKVYNIMSDKNTELRAELQERNKLAS